MRHPPLSSMRRLLTIPISHYCDKARWALERAGLVYREEPHLQLLHWLPTRRAAGTHRVPALVARQGVYRGAHAILLYANARMPAGWELYPDTIRPEVMSLERRLDGELGVDTRAMLWTALAEAPGRFVLRINNQTAPRWEQRLAHVAYPAARSLLFRYATSDRARLARTKARLDGTLDAIEHRLRDGRPFLCGDHLTGADITFAALSAPLFAPREYGLPLPDRSAFPGSLKKLFDEYADHPAIGFARGLYQRERHRTVPL